MNRLNLQNIACRLLLLGVAAVIAGCSSVKTSINNQPIKAHTFSFLNTGVKQFPGYAENRKEAHEAVQQALIKNLASKGVNYVQSGGDVIVAYLIIVGNNADTTSLNSYFGYTDDADALVKMVHKEQTEGQNRAYFEAGTLVVDFISQPGSKLLQRRSIRAELMRNLPNEARRERVDSIVAQVLKDVPISQ